MVLSPINQSCIEIAKKEVSIVFNENIENAEDDVGLDTKEISQHISRMRDAEGDDNPFTVLNLNVVYEKMVEWRSKLPQIKPYYAVKCNNDPVLLQTLSALGVGFDCASRGEIDLVIGNGLATGDEVIYANPCKTRSYIEHAQRCGINKMTFDSAEELLKIKKYHSTPELILRIDVADPEAQCQLAAKFGCDAYKEAPKLMLKAKELDLAVVGISFHVGSGCKNPIAYQKAIYASSKLFALGNKLGHNMRILDVGGGFPGQDSRHFDHIARTIQKALTDYFMDTSSEFGVKGFSGGELEIIAEPGRFFSSAAISLTANIIAKTHVLASRITNKVEDEGLQGIMYYINDGVYGSFNCILFDHFQPTGEPLFENRWAKKVLTTVWGPTCDSLDRVEACTELQDMETGDWIFYPNMGAYTSVAASNFNGFEPPQRFYIIGDKICRAIFGNTMEKKAKDRALNSGISIALTAEA